MPKDGAEIMGAYSHGLKVDLGNNKVDYMKNIEVSKIQKKLTLEQICEKLIKDIPEEKKYLDESIEFNQELLGHVYFADDFTNHLMKMLEEYQDLKTIQRYCDFIEYMWREGDSYVVNIFDVTIAEKLSDYIIIWTRFGKHISNELIDYINNDLIPNNILMKHVRHLEKN